MENTKEYEINLMYILQSLLHRWYIILLAIIMFAAGAFSCAKFLITPKYSSTVKMYVNNDSAIINDYLSSGELSVAKELVNTYLAILNTPDTLNTVIEQAELDYSANQLVEMISAGSIADTEVFYVTVTSPDPVEAAHIANIITDVLPERISHIVEKSSVKVVQRAEVSVKTSPNVLEYTLIGALVGMIASCTVIIFKELIDNSIHDENYPSKAYKIRTLGYIPNLCEKTDKKSYEKSDGNKKSRKKRRLPYSDERSILCENLPFGVAESYKMLRANLQNIAQSDSIYKVIGITSPNPCVGKSTLAINYAYSLAQTGKSVVLIDADMRKPVIAKRLLLPARSGLSDMLIDNTNYAIQDSGRLDNWKIICAGTAIDNPSELLGDRSMDLLIEKLRQTFDYVIVDLPPVNEVSDAITVSRCLDGIICAVKQGATTKINLETAMHHMTYSKAELIGFVITNANIGGKYDKYGKYGKYNRNYYSYGN